MGHSRYNSLISLYTNSDGDMTPRDGIDDNNADVINEIMPQTKQNNDKGDKKNCLIF